MLVDRDKALRDIFNFSEVIITTHCEDELTIQNNIGDQWFKLGHVTRDMQVIIDDSDNERPLLRNTIYKYMAYALCKL